MVKQIAASGGVWKRAGQAGTVVGLDWPAVQVLLPVAIDRERVLALLHHFESGMMAGARKLLEKQNPTEE